MADALDRSLLLTVQPEQHTGHHANRRVVDDLIELTPPPGTVFAP